MTENKQQKLIKKAAIYIDKKQFNKATKCLDEAYVKNGKFNALIFYFLGRISEDSDHYIEAINCLCNAVRYLNNPNNVLSKEFEYMIFLRLAEACSATGATKKALRFYEEAYKRSPESNRYSVLTSYLYCMVSGNTSPADMLK